MVGARVGQTDDAIRGVGKPRASQSGSGPAPGVSKGDGKVSSSQGREVCSSWRRPASYLVRQRVQVRHSRWFSALALRRTGRCVLVRCSCLSAFGRCSEPGEGRAKLSSSSPTVTCTPARPHSDDQQFINSVHHGIQPVQEEEQEHIRSGRQTWACSQTDELELTRCFPRSPLLQSPAASS